MVNNNMPFSADFQTSLGVVTADFFPYQNLNETGYKVSYRINKRVFEHLDRELAFLSLRHLNQVESKPKDII